METSVVKLGIPLSHNLWRIYRVTDRGDRQAGDLDVYLQEFGYHISERLIFRRWFIRFPDSMDKDGFDNATSFPTLKPDRDIFGPPGCCRKQRGWYHVKRWPPVTRTTDGVEQVGYATGADIPPELINMVVEHCRPLLYGWTKVGIGMLRLVCRRWGDLFLRNIFGSVSAASTQRITDLGALQTKRLALGWGLFPIEDCVWKLKLDQPDKMQSWVEAVIRLRRLDFFDRQELWIQGPVAPGRRFTSVYLSSPFRALWSPIPIQRLELSDVHFKKPSDLVRLLRELPFLKDVQGWKVTWDASSEEGPRVTSYIPCKWMFPEIDLKFKFIDSQRGIAGILCCALTPPSRSPIAQSDADVLYCLSADLCVFESRECFVRRAMNGGWRCCLESDHGFVDVWLEQIHTRPQVCVVQYLVFDSLSNPSILSIRWEVIATAIESLLTQPKVLFLFESTTHATFFCQHLVTVPRMASLHASNRLIFVLHDRRKEMVSVVKSSEDGEWIILARARYQSCCPDSFPFSYRIVLHRLAMLATNH